MIESSEKLRKIVSIYQVTSIGIEEIIEDGQTASIAFYDGYEWEQIKFTTATYAEPGIKTDHGTRYDQQLQIILAGDDETLQDDLIELENSKPIFRFDYDNGDSKLIGDTENYCEVINSKSSEEFETKNAIIISRLSSYPAFFLI